MLDRALNANATINGRPKARQEPRCEGVSEAATPADEKRFGFMSDSPRYSLRPSDSSQTVAPSFWKKELQLGTNRPSRATDWRLHVVVSLQVKIHRLLADLENLAKASTDGKSPLVRRRFPVRGDDRRAHQVPAVFHIVVDKGLYQQLAHIWLVRGTGYGPQLVHQGPNQKWSRDHQRHRRRADAEQGRAERPGCGCRQIESGADAPDQPARIGRRKEKALVDIAKAEVGSAKLAKPANFKALGWKGCKARLIGQRGDCAADNVPIAKRNRDHRLDVEHVSGGVMARTDLAIDVVLKRQADHRSYWVLRGFGKVLRRLLGDGGGTSGQHEHDGESESGPESRAWHFSVFLLSRPRTANVSA